MTKDDKERKKAKAEAVSKRLSEVVQNDVLFGMLDESTLDQLILALGLGKVELL